MLLLLCNALTHNTEIFHITDSEVKHNALVPTMQLFCLLDEPDPQNANKETKRLHHGYQFLYTGDPELAIDGHVSVTLLDDTDVEFEVPATVGSFAKHYDDARQQIQRKKKLSKASYNAQSTGVTHYMNDPLLLKLKYLVKFEQTGETLSNSVFDVNAEQFGAVRPKTAIVTGKFTNGGIVYPTATLYAQFSIARVEPTVRQRGVAQRRAAVSLIADDLNDDGEDHMSDEG